MKEYKISKESIVMFFLIIFSLKIGCISYISNILNMGWYITSIIAISYCFFMLIMNKKYNLFDIIALSFYIFLFIITIIKNGSIEDITKELLAFFSLFFVMRVGLESNPKKYIGLMNLVLIIYTSINTLSAIVFYPNAMFVDNMNPIFFMGGDNTSVRLYVVAILFNVLQHYIKKGKLKMPIFSLINLLVFSCIRDLGGGKVCFLILFVCTLYLVYGTKIPKKTIKLIITFNIILFFVLVIANRMDIFKFLIVNVLHRDLSLTDRTIIWKITIEKIISNPVVGHGMIDGMTFQSYLPYLIGINAHNTYLMILFNGGSILFLIFILLFFITSLKFDKIKHDRWIYIIPIALFTLMIRAQIEGWDVIWIILLLELAYSYKKIEEIDN